jgi:hypothetical protein
MSILLSMDVKQLQRKVSKNITEQFSSIWTKNTERNGEKRFEKTLLDLMRKMNKIRCTTPYIIYC